MHDRLEYSSVIRGHQIYYSHHWKDTPREPNNNYDSFAVAIVRLVFEEKKHNIVCCNWSSLVLSVLSTGKMYGYARLHRPSSVKAYRKL